MSRSGFIEDDDYYDILQNGRWQGQVASTIRGKRGQAFLRELIAALDAMPVKALIADELVTEQGEVCALGAVGCARGIDLKDYDTHDYDELAHTFGVTHQLIREIEWVNDEITYSDKGVLAEEYRWMKVREWAVKHLTPPAAP